MGSLLRWHISLFLGTLICCYLVLAFVAEWFPMLLRVGTGCLILGFVVFGISVVGRVSSMFGGGKSSGVVAVAEILIAMGLGAGGIEMIVWWEELTVFGGVIVSGITFVFVVYFMFAIDSCLDRGGALASGLPKQEFGGDLVERQRTYRRNVFSFMAISLITVVVGIFVILVGGIRLYEEFLTDDLRWLGDYLAPALGFTLARYVVIVGAMLLLLALMALVLQLPRAIFYFMRKVGFFAGMSDSD